MSFFRMTVHPQNRKMWDKSSISLKLTVAANFSFWTFLFWTIVSPTETGDLKHNKKKLLQTGRIYYHEACCTVTMKWTLKCFCSLCNIHLYLFLCQSPLNLMHFFWWQYIHKIGKCGTKVYFPYNWRFLQIFLSRLCL